MKLRAQDLGDPGAGQLADQRRGGGILDRVPGQVDAGRPFPVGILDALGKMQEFVLVFEGWVDQHEAPPLHRGNVGVKPNPAVDGDGLGPPVATQIAGKSCRSPRLEFAGGQAILRPHQT